MEGGGGRTRVSGQGSGVLHCMVRSGVCVNIELLEVQWFNLTNRY